MKAKKAAVKKLTIGLDLGDRRHHVGVLDAAGEIVAGEGIVNTPEVLTTCWGSRTGSAQEVARLTGHEKQASPVRANAGPRAAPCPPRR